MARAATSSSSVALHLRDLLVRLLLGGLDAVAGAGPRLLGRRCDALLDRCLRALELGLALGDARLRGLLGCLAGALGLLGDALLGVLAQPLGLLGELLLGGGDALGRGGGAALDLLEPLVGALEHLGLLGAQLLDLALARGELCGEALLRGLARRLDLPGGALVGLVADADQLRSRRLAGLDDGALAYLAARGLRILESALLELAPLLLERLAGATLGVGARLLLGGPAPALLGLAHLLLEIPLEQLELAAELLGLLAHAPLDVRSRVALGVGLGALGLARPRLGLLDLVERVAKRLRRRRIGGCRSGLRHRGLEPLLGLGPQLLLELAPLRAQLLARALLGVALHRRHSLAQPRAGGLARVGLDLRLLFHQALDVGLGLRGAVVGRAYARLDLAGVGLGDLLLGQLQALLGLAGALLGVLEPVARVADHPRRLEPPALGRLAQALLYLLRARRLALRDDGARLGLAQVALEPRGLRLGALLGLAQARLQLDRGRGRLLGALLGGLGAALGRAEAVLDLGEHALRLVLGALEVVLERGDLADRPQLGVLRRFGGRDANALGRVAAALLWRIARRRRRGRLPVAELLADLGLGHDDGHPFG